MTGPPRELTRSERAAIRRLVTGLCANYDEREKLCLPLDCSCYRKIKKDFLVRFL